MKQRPKCILNKAILILMVLLAGCSSSIQEKDNISAGIQTTAFSESQPVSPTTPLPLPEQEESPIIIAFPEEPQYPLPVTMQPFYFVHTLDMTWKEYSLKTNLGMIDVSYPQLNSLKDPLIKDYLNQQIRQHIAKSVSRGIPKYPGILPALRNTNIVKYTIRASCRAINNIMSLNISAQVEFDNNRYISSETYKHYDLLTGQQITVNSLMNTPHGLDELNHLVMKSMDAFVDPADVDNYKLLYKTPFQQSFQGLPEIFYFHMTPDDTAIVLNDECTSCYFDWLYGYTMTPHYLSLPSFQNTLYDRYYQKYLHDYATDGEWYFRLGRRSGTDDLNQEDVEVLDSKRNIRLTTFSKFETNSFFAQQKKQLAQEYLEKITQLEQELSLSDNWTTSAFISYWETSKYSSINLRFDLNYENKLYRGQIIRYFRADTNEQLTLPDLFAFGFDYQALIAKHVKAQLAQIPGTIKAEVILQDLPTMDFELSGNYLTFYSASLPNQNGFADYDTIPFSISVKDIGIENLAPYLKQTK